MCCEGKWSGKIIEMIDVSKMCGWIFNRNEGARSRRPSSDRFTESVQISRSESEHDRLRYSFYLSCRVYTVPRSSDNVLSALSTDARTIFAGTRSGEWTKESGTGALVWSQASCNPFGSRRSWARPGATHSPTFVVAAWPNFNSPHLRRASSPPSLFREHCHKILRIGFSSH